MTEYKRFNEQAWLKFGKNLLEGKLPDKQDEFLRACRSGKEIFLKYIDEHLLSERNSVSDGEIVKFGYKLTEQEFRFPPKDIQQIIWDAFKHAPEEIVYCNGFWGYTIFHMVKDDYIKPDYLASESNGMHKTGIYSIDDAINHASSGEHKKTDDCVRRVLRSMCNPAPRGKRVVFDYFPLGKAYWRWHWAYKMSNHLDLSFEQILQIFNETYYGSFAAKMHTSKSYIGSENTLGGLLLFLEGQKKISGGKLGKIIDRISYLSAWKAVEMQEPNLNQQEIQKIAQDL